MCNSCRNGTVVFRAIFSDTTTVFLCGSCTDDLANIVQSQMITCVIMAANGGQEDETYGYTDPAEMADI